MPYLSIIITVYNLENYIEACVKSILFDGLDDYEVIIVDDASTDKSPKICDEFAKQYPNLLRVVHLKGTHQLNRAHKLGFELAKGEYIQYIDGDDMVVPGALLRRIQALKLHQVDVLMGTFQCLLEPGGMPLKDMDFDENKFNQLSYEEKVDFMANISGFHMIFCRYTFKKSIIKEYNLFDSPVPHTNTVNDWLPVLKILMNAQSLYYIQPPFYVYRRRKSGAITSCITQGHHLDHFLAVIEQLSYFQKLKSKVLTESKQKFYAAKTAQMLKLAYVQSDQLNDESWSKIKRVEDEHRDIFESLTVLESPNLKLLYDCYKDSNKKEAILKQYAQFVDRRLKTYFENSEIKKVMVMPNAIVGQYLIRLCHSIGVEVVSLLDNDSRKWGIKYDHVLCQSPQKAVDQYCKVTTEKPVALIGSVYKELDDILANQMSAYGVEIITLDKGLEKQ